METVRAFIAIDVGEKIRHSLRSLQSELKKATADIRWVNPDNMHLTLAFPGNVSADQIEILKTAMDVLAAEIEAFQIRVCGTGYFGRPNRPRVVWAGVAPCPALSDLQTHIARALRESEIPFDDSKPFSPHLT